MLNNDSLQQLKELKIALEEQKQICEGVVKGTQHRYGFLVIDNKRQLFLPPEEMQKVFPEDTIRVIVRKDKKGKEYGEVEQVISSSLDEFVGRYVIKGKAHFVEPDISHLSRWIFIPPSNRETAENGDYVRCQILRHPLKTGKAQAKILQVLGNDQTIGIEALFTINKYGLPASWPEEVEQQLASSLEEVLKKQVAGREDLSALDFVTIDAPTTLDMDDALYAERREDGWRLFVAIADPTAVIEAGSPIELEASQRATSAYLPGKRISMLPEVISHHFCSLQANELRLATVCKIEVAADGALTNFQFVEAVICSKAKLSYSQVADHLETYVPGGDLKQIPQNLVDDISVLAEVQQALNRNREQNAILIEDNTDYRILLNDQKNIDHIEKIERNAAHKLVEECMVAANRCAAEFLKQYEQSGIYITHRGFRKERIKDVKRIVKEQYPDFVIGELDTLQGFRDLINQVESSENKLPIRAIFSRIFERSQLSLEPTPHFGMGIDIYTTFTSPIRKYSDFLMQRAIKSILKGGEIYKQDIELVEQMQAQLNTVRACSQEIEQWLKCEFMQAKKDEIYDAKICQVNSSNFTVRLSENGIEGIVNVKDMQEKYRYDPLYLMYSSHDNSFKLNDALKVKVSSIDMKQKIITFSLIKQDKTQNAVDEIPIAFESREDLTGDTAISAS